MDNKKALGLAVLIASLIGGALFLRRLLSPSEAGSDPMWRFTSDSMSRYGNGADPGY